MRRLLGSALVCVPLVVLAVSCDSGDDDCQYGYGGVATGSAGLYAQNLLRDPESGQCQDYTVYPPPGGCDVCGNCPPASGADQAPPPDWGSCYGTCAGLDETACLAAPGCQAAYVTDCAGGDCQAPPDAFYGCWDVAPSGPIEGGDCTVLGAYDCSRHDDCVAFHKRAIDCTTPGCTDPQLGAFDRCGSEESDPGAGDCYAEVTCDAPEPACPDGTLPGVVNGCYSGYCIPVDECPDAPPACSALGEMSCIDRADCTPIYQGVGCSCGASGCTCDSWDFTGCQ